MRGLLWLVARTLIIIFIAAAAITGAIFIGRQQPTSNRAAFLHLNDCELPCWIGIIPGKTTLTEAENRIRQTYESIPGYQLSQIDNTFTFTNLTNSDLIEISLSHRREFTGQLIVDEITLDPIYPLWLDYP